MISSQAHNEDIQGLLSFVLASQGRKIIGFSINSTTIVSPHIISCIGVGLAALRVYATRTSWAFAETIWE